jgi:hypothetical protein
MDGIMEGVRGQRVGIFEKMKAFVHDLDIPGYLAQLVESAREGLVVEAEGGDPEHTRSWGGAGKNIVIERQSPGKSGPRTLKKTAMFAL